MRIETAGRLIAIALFLLAALGAISLFVLAQAWQQQPRQILPEHAIGLALAAVATLACGAAAAALAWQRLLHRRVLQPLAALRQQIEECVASECPPTMPAHIPSDEIGDAIRTVLKALGTAMCDAAERRDAQALLETARRDAETAREEFIGMAESLPMAVYQLENGPGGYARFKFVSRRAEAVLGVTAQEMMQDPATRFRYAHPEDVLRVQQHIASTISRARDGGTIPLFEAELRLVRGGEERWLRMASMLIRTNADGISLWSGYYEDITERKLAALRLQMANDEQNAIFEAATVGIAFERDAVIQRGNAQLDALFGAPPGGMIGVPTASLAPLPLAEENDAASMGKRLQRGETLHQELQLLRRDGSVFWAHLSGRAVYPEDAARGNLWMLEDVTERRQYLAALLQAKELAEQAAQAKSDFLANMSHEIRTPLNAVIGMTHLMQATPLSAQQGNYTRKIHDSSRHLLGIINDILDFSKVESGNLEVERFEFDLENLLERVTGMVTEKVRQKQLELTVDVAPDVPLQIEGDELRLGQILVNYANNAVKFTEHGAITLSVRVQEREGDDVLLRFAVADTGIGLTPEQIKRLFQSFAQADASTTRKHGGTGLGLAISKRLAQLMGGDVGVQSEYGRGSNFWFTVRVRACARAGKEGLPASEAGLAGNFAGALPQPVHAARVAARAALAGAAILLVEDNDLNQEVATALLREVGCEADVASNGKQAIEKAQQGVYDLILMDMQMPVMDGVTATRLIRNIDHLRDLPIIAMTANVMRQDRERCLAAGMNDFVGKPIDPVELWRILQKWHRPAVRRSPAEALVLAEPEAQAPSSPWPETIHGLDMAQGRSRVLGNETLYRSMLRRFVDGQADSAQQIEQALATQQVALAERLVHTAKSVAGNIGAVAVQAAAQALEQALREGAPPTIQQPLLRAYAQTLQALLNGLAPAVAAAFPPLSPATGMAATEPAQQAQVCARLRHLLQENDPEAGHWFEAHAAMLRRALGHGQFGEVQRALETFDLEVALDALVRATTKGAPQGTPQGSPLHAGK